jgi:hypothetical protein
MPWKDPETGDEISIYPTAEFSADIERYSAEECTHERQDLRWSTNAIGARHLRMQCLECGLLIGNARSGKTAPEGISDEDTELLTRYLAKRRQQLRSIYHKHQELQLRQQTDFRSQHAEYLKSPAWRRKRSKVFERSGGLCEGCREQPAKEVHHLTYEHWQNELLFELVALCPVCHLLCHDDFEVVE